MTETEIREKYRAFLSDPNFDKIELELRAPNIFQILDITRTEIRHSNFLSWLLDPNGTHGLGKLFLIKFLRGLAASEITTDLDELDIENLNFNDVELRREWHNIDLLIVFDTLVVCVENKIDTQDHSNQLSKYREIVNKNFKNHKKVFVYLTPDGEEPNEANERQFYATYSYESIIEQADRVLRVHGSSLNSGVRQYISDYLTITKRELMKDDDLNKLAGKIYKSHKDLFEFIFENKPDALEELHDILVERIKKGKEGWALGSSNKRYIRFLTKALKPVIPTKGQGDWPLKECFLFEFQISWRRKKVIFKTTISPGDATIREILIGALENIPGFKKPIGKKWLIYFRHDWEFGNEDMTEVDEEEFLEKLEEELPTVKSIVGKVETELLKHKDELKKHL